ncbi:hypothetical protein VNO80_05818 [Phaseolus coccineus]|uniref:Uncharacterized protein n=1 Tax=Phaseolus coccineus TaxID=3886 RepID=A0AAN9RE15_PHACN
MHRCPRNVRLVHVSQVLIHGISVTMQKLAAINADTSPFFSISILTVTALISSIIRLGVSRYLGQNDM